MAWSRQDSQVATPSFTGENRARTELTHVATIGKSLQLKGELSGDEDLNIEGKVDGKIILNGHTVTIGPNGRVSAAIQAKAVIVAGEVRGNLNADDKVEVAATGNLLGDIRAPRVVLADGARFKGSVDMTAKPASSTQAAAPTSHNEAPAYAKAT